MTERNQLVSIIVRTKDRPSLLKRALQSIAAQTYKPIEVILVNDGGCDLDVHEISAILNDVELRYIRLKSNAGRANAGNVGVNNARGKYTGFLDDDDEFHEDHIATLVHFLNQSEYRVAYSDAFFVYKTHDSDTRELKEIKKEIAFSEDFNYDSLVFENYIPFMCLLFETGELLETGGFDSKLDLYEDWDMLLRIGEKYPFHHIKKITVDYNQWSSELQVSQNNRDLHFLKRAYCQIISKHIGKLTPERIHGFVSSHVQVTNLLSDLRNQMDQYIAQLDLNSERMGSLEAAMKGKDERIGSLEAAMKGKDERIGSLEQALMNIESRVQTIQDGHAWKILTKFFEVRDRLLPEGTKRHLFARLLHKAIVNPREARRNINTINLKKFLVYFRINDLLTLEKKIEQKLSPETIGPKSLYNETNERSVLLKRDMPDSIHLYETNTDVSRDYVPFLPQEQIETDIKLIAFYLPQFHPIRENDKWWGKGFTEWSNVTRAVPQFTGHYQPRLPGELGFYDLRIPEVQERQVELAKHYGIFGFCFHFYWFNGVTLLEMPTKNFAKNISFPFCLNWANENWTRRWDGKGNDVLIGQKHSPEDDIAFIRHVSEYLKNDNYIRVKSRPLLIVYRPSLFPDPKATAERWRVWCSKNGIGEIHLAAVHSFEHVVPESIGFDSAIEFPPNTFPLKDISGKMQLLRANYKGVILDYRHLIEFSTNYSKPNYKKLRGICPSWDNEARKPGRGTALMNCTPDNFREWLKVLCHFTSDNFAAEERIIFMNAWNEWAEGAYLEPDRRYGYAYLQAVADTLRKYNLERRRRKIIYVCHDAHFHGAQLLSLHIIRMLKLKFSYDVHFILKSGGELESEYQKYAIVYNLERDYKTHREKEGLFKRLYNFGIRQAICNSVASGDIAKLIHAHGIKVTSLVHELPGIIKQLNIQEKAKDMAACSENLVFASNIVKEQFKTVALLNDERAVILPQGLYKQNGFKQRQEEARRLLRERYSLPGDARIILGVGFGDYRKGIDLFFEVAKRIARERDDVYFLWVGNLHIEIRETIVQELETSANVILENAQKDVSLFYAGSDIYLLTSREDPFPTVVLEAMEVGLPVIGFHDAGGFSDIVNKNTGTLVPFLDVNDMAKEVLDLLNDHERMKALRSNSSKLIEEKFNFTDYVYSLLALLGHAYKKVSVVIPNYNYERYLTLRIRSILNQTYPIYEIIFLDDASVDRSVEIVRNLLVEDLNTRIIINEANSGSAFRQWMKGLRLVKGDYIWIAEADDLCEETLLEELLTCFEKDTDVVLAYCQSKQIDEAGRILADNYFEYTNDIDKVKWLRDYVREGVAEISDTLVIKNTIPNASAVVFRKTDISAIADEIESFKVAGDWFFYVWLLRKGKIAYVAKSLNSHRRHKKGVTKTEDKGLHYKDVVRMQDYVLGTFPVAADAHDKTFSYREYLIGYFDLK
ncbi:MAG: glycoside hydrolase family 99-like domain-containing protein [Dissulfurispiraceae bacterium]